MSVFSPPGQTDIYAAHPEDRHHLDGGQRSVVTDINLNEKSWIKLDEFTADHFPKPYRDSHLLDFIHAQAAVTVRLSVSQVSKDRPPGNMRPDSSTELIAGSGSVIEVITYTEEDNLKCECRECINSPSPKNVWGRFVVQTTPDVVYNQEEANHCTCTFPHNILTTNPGLSGMKLYTVFPDLETHRRTLFYITHDMELLEKTEDLVRRKIKLYRLIRNKFRCGQSSQNLAIIVSHPHGQGKHVTVGYLKKRTVVGRRKDGIEATEYTYTTPTCPGTSGAPLFTFENVSDFWYHLHSRGDDNNINTCSAWWDPV